MDFLRGWFLSMAGAAMLGVFAIAVTPHGAVRRVVQIAAALVTVITVLRPLTGVESFHIRGVEDFFSEKTEPVLKTSVEEILSSIIAGQTSAYIVSKAEASGLVVSVTAYCRMGEHYPEPWSVAIYSERPEHAKRVLKNLITEDLGIPLERQFYEERIVAPDTAEQELKGVEP
jgi:hypothetical protein